MIEVYASIDKCDQNQDTPKVGTLYVALRMNFVRMNSQNTDVLAHMEINSEQNILKNTGDYK